MAFQYEIITIASTVLIQILLLVFIRIVYKRAVKSNDPKWSLLFRPSAFSGSARSILYIFALFHSVIIFKWLLVPLLAQFMAANLKMSEIDFMGWLYLLVLIGGSIHFVIFVALDKALYIKAWREIPDKIPAPILKDRFILSIILEVLTWGLLFCLVGLMPSSK